MRCPAWVLLVCFAAGAASAEWSTVEILGEQVAPGSRWRLAWVGTESFVGDAVPVPVLVLRGGAEGATLCMTAGVHGDELNGIEIVRRVLVHLDPATLRGMVVGVPIVNLHGFRRASRYLPDRRDLNRYFPGRERGSSASRIAYSFFDELVRHCTALVDFHTGSFHRGNIPQLRADLRNPRVHELARGFGAEAVVHNAGAVGTLRRAASDAGIPAITYEGGEPMRFQLDEVERGVSGVLRLLGSLGMVDTISGGSDRQELYQQSRWIRVDDGGILLARVKLGQSVEEGALLGTVTDPISNETTPVVAPFSGRVIGMAHNQVVLPGFAAFHLAVTDSGIPIGEDEEASPDQAPGEAVDLDVRPE